MNTNRNLHPQQFVTFFHGTNAKAAESIRRTGLRSSGDGVFMATPDRPMAETYAQDWAGYPEHGDPEVVSFTLPRRVANAYVSTEQVEDDEAPDGRKVWLRRTVPPKYISPG